jgi:hypothetical protein
MEGRMSTSDRLNTTVAGAVIGLREATGQRLQQFQKDHLLSNLEMAQAFGASVDDYRSFIDGTGYPTIEQAYMFHEFKFYDPQIRIGPDERDHVLASMGYLHICIIRLFMKYPELLALITRLDGPDYAEEHYPHHFHALMAIHGLVTEI